MTLKIGDKISVIDEAICGIVFKIDKNTIVIKTGDGFLLDFNPSELIKMDSQPKLDSNLFFKHSINAVIKEKESSSPQKSKRVKPKARNTPKMEVDLHINQLISSTKGMSKHDLLTLQLDTAKRQLEFAIKKRIQKIVFIHGVGEGVLKLELEYLFQHYDHIKYYDADYQKYGLGATEVYIYQNSSS